VRLDRVPLVPVAAAFAAGIAAAPWTRAGVAWAAWGAAVAACAALLALGRASWGAAALLAGVAATGALRGAESPLPPDHVARLELPRIARVEGRVVAAPVRWAPDRSRVLIDAERVDGATRSGRIQATVYGPAPPLAEGQRVAAEVRLQPVLGFRNPDGFDYAAHLAREGIRVTASTRAERLTPLEPPRPPWPAHVRARALAAIAEALPPGSAALLAGLLLGERAELPRELDEGFRRAGVYHVLAVSGFNVALLAGTVFALCALLRLDRRLSAVAAIALVLGFAAVVGPEPSVLRATIMAVLVLAALLLGREAAVANSLALAALLILALRPGDLLDPGFQLSFAATAGIVAAPLPRGLVWGALGVSLAAQLAVLPIALVHFNQLSTIGVAANLGVVPLAGLATILGLLAVALALVSAALADVAFNAAWPVLLALRAVVAAAAAVPGALVHLPAPGWPAIACYVAALGLGLAWWHTRAASPRASRRAGVAALGSLACALALEAWPLARPPDGRLRLTVLDVGQGDAIVLEAPDGRAALIDAGSGGPMRLDAGERVVAPFLWNRGVLRLAATVVTHADADHAGGMHAIRSDFRIAETWDVEALGRGPRWLGGAMVSLVSPREAWQAGSRDRAETRSFWAPPAAPSSITLPAAVGRSRNNEALVVRVEYGLASFLLASDIEAPRELELVASGTPLAAAVLKVAHHGSRSSTTPEFLAAVGPGVAVVSVGARNPYGHPDAGVLARLAAAGARVYRTDRDGAVVLETDGRTLTVTRWATRVAERFCLDPEAIC
jgi:competence protein ComEC